MQIGVDLDQAHLLSVNFTGTDLDEAILAEIDWGLASVTWSNTTCPDGTNSSQDGGTCENNLNGH
jgi:uncharacterized protein YjbI with pentapeptide repeats